MKIVCLTTFLDGRDRYEKDDQRTVSDADGARFVANGWARDVAGEAAPIAASGDVTLAIDNSILGLGDSRG